MSLLAAIFFILSCVVGSLFYREKNKNDSLELLNVQKQESISKLVANLDAKELQLQNYRNNYSNIIDIDEAIEKRNNKLLQVENQIATLKSDYVNKKKIYDNLLSQVALYDEQIQLADMGFYKPHFDFGTSEKYKEVIKNNREKQKKLVQDGKAVTGSIAWTVNGSEKEGAKMVKQAIQLTTRSFNNECEATIANTTWKNVERMEERIKKAFDVINKFNQSNQIYISHDFLNLKLDELRLVYEHKLKIQQEKEEQAELRRQEKEEEQLKKEAERAKKEEEKLQNLLSKVQEKALTSSGEELEKLKAEIAKLGEELKDMQREHSRVKAMAEQTKLGYVYVISNIGSFGENVFKIGMTRRLEPLDRVRELGDASVPFYFDVHAMIFSENAPALEAEIQRAFADRRLNLVNFRKEFFKVTLDEIKQKVFEIDPKVEFVDEVEAQEYFESIELRQKMNPITNDNEMPNTI